MLKKLYLGKIGMYAKWLELWNEEDGAVTVDWVVLTAAIVVLGVVIMVPVRAGMQTETDAVVAGMTAAVTEGLER